MGADRELGSREATGMGVKDEAMGNIIGGQGLKDIGKLHEDN